MSNTDESVPNSENESRTMYEQSLDLDVEDIDLETVDSKLREWEREFRERYVNGGEEWHAPEYWWSQRVGKLALLIEHKIDQDRIDELFDEDE